MTNSPLSTREHLLDDVLPIRLHLAGKCCCSTAAVSHDSRSLLQGIPPDIEVLDPQLALQRFAMLIRQQRKGALIEGQFQNIWSIPLPPSQDASEMASGNCIATCRDLMNVDWVTEHASLPATSGPSSMSSPISCKPAVVDLCIIHLVAMAQVACLAAVGFRATAAGLLRNPSFARPLR